MIFIHLSQSWHVTNDGMMRHLSFKRLMPWLRSHLRHSSGPHGSRLPEHLWEKVLLHHAHNEFADEFSNAHVPKLCLPRQSPDHIQIERQFSCPLRALVLKSDRDARGSSASNGCNRSCRGFAAGDDSVGPDREFS